ncbi:MAG: DUF2283 domain-containing protein [Nanoarchaeota archaeon]|nr:DUF2283 domain-containing protein [Patescibacteria group bacterium]MBU4456700.1 DUF2283 domain-containing protein [Nanoarchaeota archaeon]
MKKRAKGQVDYDYKNDILFFKTSNREYIKSIELDNIILDIDKEDFIVGIQMFEASKFLKIDKTKLRQIPNWNFTAKSEQVKEKGKKITKIEIRLDFKMKYRNKIIEKNPIIMPQPIDEMLPNREMVCCTA